MTSRVYVALFTGSRNWTDHTVVETAVVELVRLEPYLLVVTGGAAGVDSIADATARAHGAHTAVVRALWDHGKSAGPVRNRVMLDLAPAYVFAFRSSGESPGADDCIGEAMRRGLPITVFHEDGLIQRVAARPVQGSLLDANAG